MAEETRNNDQHLPDDDLLLVDRMVAGDRTASETLVRLHERRIFRVTLAVLGNAEDAEEAMQDAFVKAHRYIGQFRGDSRFTTWLTPIAVNEALQSRKTCRRSISLDRVAEAELNVFPHRSLQWHEDPERLFGKQEIKKIVEDAIQSLPPIYRETFILRDVEGFRAEEAAEILGLTLPAIKSRLLRARLLMREALSDRLENSPALPKKLLIQAGQVRDMIAMKLHSEGSARIPAPCRDSLPSF